MPMDLASLPPLVIESILSKMNYEDFTRTRQASRGISNFIDHRRRYIPVYRNVFALQFRQNKKAFIRPTIDETSFLQDPATFSKEFPFLRPQVVAFNSLDMAEAMERVHLVKTRGIELIVENISEAAVIYISSILRPKVFYSQDTEFSKDILNHPGFQDVESIHIKSPQEFIDLSSCGLKTKKLIVDMSYADCPDKQILRLLKMWECGLGSLSRMELQFDDESQSIDLCEDIVEHCGAHPIFMREIHEDGPLADICIDKFKSPHFDRLMVVSNRSFTNPQAAVILFQRGKFFFESTNSTGAFYGVLNKLGNSIFVEGFKLEFSRVVSVFQQEDK